MEPEIVLPNELEKLISTNRELIVRHDTRMRIPHFDSRKLKKKIKFCRELLELSEFYGIDKNHLFSGLEMVKNVLAHGEKRGSYSLFIGDKGVGHGVWDAGEYFKNLRIKREWEERDVIISRGKKIEGLCGFVEGRSFVINCYNELIEVDVEEGILYCASIYGKRFLFDEDHSNVEMIRRGLKNLKK